MPSLIQAPHSSCSGTRFERRPRHIPSHHKPKWSSGPQWHSRHALAELSSWIIEFLMMPPLGALTLSVAESGLSELQWTTSRHTRWPGPAQSRTRQDADARSGREDTQETARGKGSVRDRLRCRDG